MPRFLSGDTAHNFRNLAVGAVVLLTGTGQVLAATGHDILNDPLLGKDRPTEEQVATCVGKNAIPFMWLQWFSQTRGGMMTMPVYANYSGNQPEIVDSYTVSILDKPQETARQVLTRVCRTNPHFDLDSERGPYGVAGKTPSLIENETRERLRFKGLLPY